MKRVTSGVTGQVLKVVPAGRSVRYRDIKDINDKTIRLGQGGVPSIMINTQDELNYYSKIHGIQLIPANQDETNMFLQRQSKVGSINSNLSKDDVECLRVLQEEEEALKDILINQGFDIKKISPSVSTTNYVKKVSDIAIVKEFKRRIDMNPNLLDALNVIMDDQPSVDVKDMSDEEFKQLALEKGFIGLRKSDVSKEVDNNEWES